MNGADTLCSSNGLQESHKPLFAWSLVLRNSVIHAVHQLLVRANQAHTDIYVMSCPRDGSPAGGHLSLGNMHI